jgi:hypothetical protein
MSKLEKTVTVKLQDDDSSCVGRNGTFKVKTIRLVPDGDDHLRMEFVSGKLSRVLNAGARISVDDMNSLVGAWVEAHDPVEGSRPEVSQKLYGARRVLKQIVAMANDTLEKT